MARLEITDTVGNRVKRPSRVAIGRVLDSPVNLTGAGPPDYAMVFCEDRAVSLVRSGRDPLSARYCLSEGADSIESPAGRRDVLIRLFLAICRGEDPEALPMARLRAQASRPVYVQKTLW